MPIVEIERFIKWDSGFSSLRKLSANLDTRFLMKISLIVRHFCRQVCRRVVVDKLAFGQDGLKSGDTKCLLWSRQSLVGIPGAMNSVSSPMLSFSTPTRFSTH